MEEKKEGTRLLEMILGSLARFGFFSLSSLLSFKGRSELPAMALLATGGRIRLLLLLLLMLKEKLSQEELRESWTRDGAGN